MLRTVDGMQAIDAVEAAIDAVIDGAKTVSKS